MRIETSPPSAARTHITHACNVASSHRRARDFTISSRVSVASFASFESEMSVQDAAAIISRVSQSKLAARGSVIAAVSPYYSIHAILRYRWIDSCEGTRVDHGICIMYRICVRRSILYRQLTARVTNRSRSNGPIPRESLRLHRSFFVYRLSRIGRRGTRAE